MLGRETGLRAWRFQTVFWRRWASGLLAAGWAAGVACSVAYSAPHLRGTSCLEFHLHPLCPGQPTQTGKGCDRGRCSSHGKGRNSKVSCEKVRPVRCTFR